jgi:hypothetical protein
MACKKSDLIAAVNSFGAARASGDINLITFAGTLIGSLIETLEFASEENDTVEKTEEETAE